MTERVEADEVERGTGASRVTSRAQVVVAFLGVHEPVERRELGRLMTGAGMSAWQVASAVGEAVASGYVRYDGSLLRLTSRARRHLATRYGRLRERLAGMKGGQA